MITELEEAADQAWARYRLRSQEQEAWINTRVKSAEENIVAEAHGIFTDLEGLEVESDRLRALVTDARIAEAQASEKWPTGAVFCEWGRGYCGRDSWRIEHRAVVEVVTRETVFPALRNRERLGTIILRHLKKDGAPGLNYSRPYGKWLPEGETP